MNIIKYQPGYKVYHATSSCINPLTWEMFCVEILVGWSKQTNLEKRVFLPNLELVPDLKEFDEQVKQTRQRMFSAEAYKMAKKDFLAGAKVLGMVVQLTAPTKTSFSLESTSGSTRLTMSLSWRANKKLSANHVSRNI
ncbi:hypothetical protein DSO57_1020769 [Entomophthora muscae]|uniref:Uncharacterized protein n=1 Tax=Entomophthora muscae TaxID=34485 RepID=A0ACC2RUM7_9FUNG|nr:hypothetical protein DSO57_1020769 [Entomophthora muscae]